MVILATRPQAHWYNPRARGEYILDRGQQCREVQMTSFAAGARWRWLEPWDTAELLIFISQSQLIITHDSHRIEQFQITVYIRYPYLCRPRLNQKKCGLAGNRQDSELVSKNLSSERTSLRTSRLCSLRHILSASLPRSH